ncbi:EAL domain-containing protein [Pseudomonas citronellolis]|uniref:EAL domain-containing protein n=1 Tax=Pseudomonas citronellolis TaxID=53408 RepID=UPI0026463A39|nr:EAL domain-containing protein [Pseudomonas citronellolis]
MQPGAICLSASARSRRCISAFLIGGTTALSINGSTFRTEPRPATCWSFVFLGLGTVFEYRLGTHFSSLQSRKARALVDHIKIDQPFASGLDSYKEPAAIVKSIIELAHSLSVEVAAEGGNRTTSWTCGPAGSEKAQGYCIGKPISGRDFPP